METLKKAIEKNDAAEMKSAMDALNAGAAQGGGDDVSLGQRRRRRRGRGRRSRQSPGGDDERGAADRPAT